MDDREDIRGLSQSFVCRLLEMVEAGLVTYRELMPWADSVVLRLDRPPAWVLELAVKKYRGHLIDAIRSYLSAAPWEPPPDPLPPPTIAADDHVASLYLRYERRELSWATFLWLAGSKADCSGGCRRECEYFFADLNELEGADFAPEVERRQRQSVQTDFLDVIDSVRGTYASFRKLRDARKDEVARGAAGGVNG